MWFLKGPSLLRVQLDNWVVIPTTSLWCGSCVSAIASTLVGEKVCMWAVEGTFNYRRNLPCKVAWQTFRYKEKNSWHAFHLGWSTTQRNFLIYLRTLICEKCEPPGKEGDYTYSLRVFIGGRFLPLLRSRWMDPPSCALWYTNIKVHDNLHHVLYNG